MTYPDITQLPDAPSRGSDISTEFSNKTDALLTALQPFVDDVNAAGEYIQDAATEVESNASIAQKAADSALGASNWAGNWEDGGSGTAGQSFSYLNTLIYLLKVDLTNILTSEPSLSNTDWQLINSVDYTVTETATVDLDFTTETYNTYEGFGSGFGQKPLLDISTFTRSSVATGVGANLSIGTAAANIPRIVYDGDTGECLGYQAEESRTNLLTHSNTFDNATWVTSSGISVSSGQDSPSGLNDGYLLETVSGSVFANIRQSITGLSGDVTLSVRVKNVSSESLTLYLTGELSTGETNSGYSFDFSTETFSKKSGGDAIARFTKTNDGFYVISLTFDIVSISNVRFYNVFGNSASESSCIIYGAQLEAGSFPTSYIPTTTSTVTRSADSMSLSVGDNLNQSSFSLYWEGSFPEGFFTSGGTNSAILGLTDNSYSNGIAIIGNSGNSSIRLLARASNTPALSTTALIAAASGSYKFLLSYDDSEDVVKFYSNGVLLYSSSAGLSGVLDFSALDTMEIAQGWNGNAFGQIFTKKSRLYNKALSGADAIRLTIQGV